MFENNAITLHMEKGRAKWFDNSLTNKFAISQLVDDTTGRLVNSRSTQIAE